MFASQLTINDGTADKVYDQVAFGTYEATRREAAAPLDQPNTMRIAHDVKSKETRTLVDFSRVVEDATTGEQDTIRCYSVFVVPSKVATSAQVTSVATSLKNFLGGAGNIAKLINCEA